jgi:uncharacterized protein (TIGR02145 family)
MKKQNIYYSLLIGLIVIVISACKQDNPVPSNPLNGRTTAIFNPNKNYGTMTDIDGNIYKTIKIGKQIWMAENLRVTRYQNGDSIPNITDNQEWAALTSGAYCNYNNTLDLDTIATFGRLYNWYAVNDARNIAPEGWHVPDIGDWATLFEYLGGDTIASYHLKEVGGTHWDDLNSSDNGSGFTALPGGWRYLSNNIDQIGFYGDWWTSSEYNETSAGFLYLFCWDSKVWKGINYKQNGYSIRLIKDMN